MPLLVAMLGARDDGVKEAAAGALENMALGDGGSAEIAMAGAIPPLVLLLDGGSDVAKEPAAGAIENLALHQKLRPHVVEAGAIVPLLKARPPPLHLTRTLPIPARSCLPLFCPALQVPLQSEPLISLPRCSTADLRASLRRQQAHCKTWLSTLIPVPP